MSRLNPLAAEFHSVFECVDDGGWTEEEYCEMENYCNDEEFDEDEIGYTKEYAELMERLEFQMEYLIALEKVSCPKVSWGAWLSSWVSWPFSWLWR